MKPKAPHLYLHICYECGHRDCSRKWQYKACERCKSDDTWRITLGRVWELND